MQSSPGVFVTDMVNRHKMMLPIEEIVASMERPLVRAIKGGLTYGMPLNIDHDKCRSAGWCVPRGVYIASDMARQLGVVFQPDTDKDRALLNQLRLQFDAEWNRNEAEPHKEALESLRAELPGEHLEFWHVEGSGFTAPGLAAAVCPDLFATSNGMVDKDGLVDYQRLLELATQVHPGVFHLRKTDVLLYAHPFFRRSLSRRNSLNSYALRSFHEAAIHESVSNARLKLDPDLIGLPASAGPTIMELEYWHGPIFDDAIETIASGVSEHSNHFGDRNLAGISRTHFWWKDPETRRDEHGAEYQVRTSEIEELLEDPSPGLDREFYGCRYAHAEYDLSQLAISHFDGAIRAYNGDAYLERLDRLISRAGKRAQYTKLFRLDGQISVKSWKRVLSDFFRGNQLVPEYLGAPADDRPSPPPPEPSWPVPAVPRLGAYIALDAARVKSPEEISLVGDQKVLLDEEVLAVAEVGLGEAAEVMQSWAHNVATMSGDDDTANFARIVLPERSLSKTWNEVADKMATAVATDAMAGITKSASLAFEWQRDGVAISVSLAGDAGCVANVLRGAVTIIRPEDWPSRWIASFRDLILTHAPLLEVPVDWPAEAADVRRLALNRADETRATIWKPTGSLF